MSLEVCNECVEKEQSFYKCSKCSATLCIHNFRIHKCGNINLGLRAERSPRRNTDITKQSWEKELRKQKNKFVLEIRDDLTFMVDYPWYPFTQLIGWIPTQRSNFRTENKSSFSLNHYLQGVENRSPDPLKYQRRFEHKNWVRYQLNAFMKRWEESGSYYKRENSQRTTKFQLQFIQYVETDLANLRKHGITIKFTPKAKERLNQLKTNMLEGFDITIFPENEQLVVKWSKNTDKWFQPLILIFIDYLTILYISNESEKSILPSITQKNDRELSIAYWAIFRAMQFWQGFKSVLAAQKHPPVILNFTPYELPSVPWRHIQKEAKKKFELRPYQQDALTIWQEFNYFGSEQLPTGAGKTLIGIGAIWKTKNRTLILVPNLDLIEQWKERIKTFLDIPDHFIGIFSGYKKDFDKDIVISTYQLLSQYIQDYLIGTKEKFSSNNGIKAENIQNLDQESENQSRRSLEVVKRAYDYFTSQFGLLIADECHHVQAKTFKEIALNLTIPRRLALSATIDWETNTSMIFAAMGSIIYGITYGTLSKIGFIPPIIYKNVKIPLTSEEKAKLTSKNGKTQGFRSTLSREAENKYLMIKKIINAPFTEQILVFTSRISHAELIHQYLHHEGIESHLLVGTTISNAREREELLQKFRTKKIHVLILVKMLNEGFDAPADTVIIASGSKNRREHVQRSGRTTRLGHVAKIFELVVDKDDLDTEYLVSQQRDIKNIIEPWIQDKLVEPHLLQQIDRLIRTDLPLSPTIKA